MGRRFSGHLVSHATLARPSRMTRKTEVPRVPDRTMVANLTMFCFAGFRTNRLRCEEAMKTAGRENPNRWAKIASNRAHGAAVQHRSCSIKWAAKREKVRPLEECFFLTSPLQKLLQGCAIVIWRPS